MKMKFEIGRLTLEPIMTNYTQQLSLKQNQIICYKVNDATYTMKFEDLIRENENEELGAGVSSIVMEMMHVESNKKFAVKRVPKYFYKQNLDQEQLVETEALAQLQSFEDDDFLKYYGYFDRESYIWIITEHMDCSLHVLYTKAKTMNAKIPEKILAKVAYTVLKTVESLLEVGMFHRDYKPDNILINSNGEIKVCDFGEVGLLSDDNKCRNKIKGTERYKAPEKFTNQTDSYSVKSEFWSLGLTLLELATLKKPFENTNLAFLTSVIRDVSEEELLNFEDTYYSSNFRDFLALCLKKDENERAELETLLNHAFVKQIEIEERELEFLHNVIVRQKK